MDRLLQHRNLLYQLIKRDVVGRYRGSVGGLLWSLFYPLFLLGIYYFAFGLVLKARWGLSEVQAGTFALLLFSGVIVHSLFTESVNRSVLVIVHNATYVKKLVFPLEVLLVANLGATLFHSAISVGLLILLISIADGVLHPTVLLVPVVFAPFAVLILGLTYLLSAIGVYLRDLAQVVPLLSLGLLFLSPVFYPLASVPEPYHTFMLLNPLTIIIEQLREVAVFGRAPNWAYLGLYSGVAIGMLVFGMAIFRRARRGFADVL